LSPIPPPNIATWLNSWITLRLMTEPLFFFYNEWTSQIKLFRLPIADDYYPDEGMYKLRYHDPTNVVRREFPIYHDP
ncbi:hypothetical protein PFISCL1PPCAC_1227, partial [Pristionchus fissidentatus]